MKKLYFFITLILAVIVFAPASKVLAADGFTYYDVMTKKKVKYTGTIPRYKADGDYIDFGSRDPIINDKGYALADAGTVFRDYFDLNYKFNSSEKSVTLWNGETTLKMWANKTKALLNGEEIELPTKPMRIRYNATYLYAFLVPTRFVADTFGIYYKWDSSSGTVSMLYQVDYSKPVWPENSSFTFDLKLAPSVSVADVDYEEDCWNYTDRFIFEGDVSQFYKKEADAILNGDFPIDEINVIYDNLTDETHFDIVTDEFYCCVFENVLNSFGERVMRLTFDHPSKIYDKIVVIDAGHGGKDPGAQKSGTNEKDINLSIAELVEEDLTDCGIKVFMTRYDDTFIELDTRAAFARECEADFFISIHQNANNSSSVNGTYVYYHSFNKAVFGDSTDSRTIAQLAVDNICAWTGSKNKGVVDQALSVTTKNSVPSILIECGFMTNASELKKLKKAGYQQKIADGIVDTVEEVYENEGR